MPGSFALGIVIVCIGSVYVPHYLRQVPLGCLQQQMIMIAHEAIGVDFCSFVIHHGHAGRGDILPPFAVPPITGPELTTGAAKWGILPVPMTSLMVAAESHELNPE